jgi:hypothetical protein
MGRCNLSQVFRIYTCGRHENSNKPTATKTTTHLGFATSATVPPRLLHLVHRCASAIGRAGLQNRHPQRYCKERVNKVFGKRSSWLLARFIKLFTTARLPLHQSRAEGYRLHRELHQADRRLHPVIIVKELQVTYSFCSQIMAYIFNILIYVGMILLDNLLQCFLFIAMIDLFRTCGIVTILVCYALVMFIIYSWIKIKPKVLIYQNGTTPSLVWFESEIHTHRIKTASALLWQVYN